VARFGGSREGRRMRLHDLCTCTQLEPVSQASEPPVERLRLGRPVVELRTDRQGTKGEEASPRTNPGSMITYHHPQQRPGPRRHALGLGVLLSHANCLGLAPAVVRAPRPRPRREALTQC
jgi:hypothetical protein